MDKFDNMGGGDSAFGQWRLQEANQAEFGAQLGA
jgi:hypothetical protein